MDTDNCDRIKIYQSWDEVRLMQDMVHLPETEKKKRFVDKNKNKMIKQVHVLYFSIEKNSEQKTESKHTTILWSDEIFAK